MNNLEIEDASGDEFFDTTQAIDFNILPPTTTVSDDELEEEFEDRTITNPEDMSISINQSNISTATPLIGM